MEHYLALREVSSAFGLQQFSGSMSCLASETKDIIIANVRRKTACRTAASSLWVSGLNLVKIQSTYFDMFLFSLLDLLTVRSSSFVMLFIRIHISSLIGKNKCNPISQSPCLSLLSIHFL